MMQNVQHSDGKQTCTIHETDIKMTLKNRTDIKIEQTLKLVNSIGYNTGTLSLRGPLDLQSLSIIHSANSAHSK